MGQFRTSRLQRKHKFIKGFSEIISSGVSWFPVVFSRHGHVFGHVTKPHSLAIRASLFLLDTSHQCGGYSAAMWGLLRSRGRVGVVPGGVAGQPSAKSVRHPPQKRKFLSTLFAIIRRAFPLQRPPCAELPPPHEHAKQTQSAQEEKQIRWKK